VRMIWTFVYQRLSPEFHPSQIIPALAFIYEFLAALFKDGQIIFIFTTIYKWCGVSTCTESTVTYLLDIGSWIAAFGINDLSKHQQAVCFAIHRPVVSEIPFVGIVGAKEFHQCRIFNGHFGW